jgi:hypothetical protein
MSVLTGFRARVQRRTSAPDPALIPAQRRWVPEPVRTHYVADRPAALVPLAVLVLPVALAGMFRPLFLVPAAVLVVAVAALHVHWRRARRLAARRNAQLSTRPGRHARPDTATRPDTAPGPDTVRVGRHARRDPA